jgi:hypothetical protein
LNNIARMTARERSDIFSETAAQMGVAEAIVEKDFWVCWVLKQLFSINSLKRRLLFKGGTSLSKVFHAINRFSEDIDLAVDYAALGFVDARDPRQVGLSKTKRAAILTEMMAACQHYISTEFIDALRARCQEVLGSAESWTIEVDPHDPNVVSFHYPAAIQTLPYLRPQVLLELGTHAEFVPHGEFTIRSFAVEQFPKLTPDGKVSVTALLAQRTFWEKATILHAEYYRPTQKPIPDRYSRHYYDVALLAESPFRATALAEETMLEQVVTHKETFYPSAWARYDLARRGSLRLVPPKERQGELERDYRSMGVMIFGEPPIFDSIMKTLAKLEDEINA